MDYCSSCRRHLNGALVCPGCGAYAPDIAPPSALRPAVPSCENPATAHGRPDFGPGDTAPVAAPAQDIAAEVAPPAPQGRAARRRQLARWKKNKRRAAVATAVAIVGGGLTVASLDRHSADRAQAATAPENNPTGSAQEPTVEQTRPASTPPPGRHRSAHPTPPAQPLPANAPHQQSAAAPDPTSPTMTRPDAATTPRPATTSAPKARAASAATGSAATGDTGTTAQQPSTPAPTQTGGTGSGTSQTSPSPAATSPSELCLLVVCLG
ncbi:hypothetical protein ACFY1J_27085 [Streptomyces sp. NPDC001406]|uniref:SCO2400 family protein n=1 Tax=Streptomyces sp. NPDC001406 TaxID=3364572 RepID=UPI00368A327D